MLEYVIDRIGKRRPARVYIRAWMERLGVNNKTLAGRMGRAESTVSKLLSQADPTARAKGSKQKITVEYLTEFAEALGLESPADLFRDPDQPSRDELLRGYSNEEVIVALQVIDTARTKTSQNVRGQVSSTTERAAGNTPQKRSAARR